MSESLLRNDKAKKYNIWLIIIINAAISVVAGFICLFDSDVPESYRYLFLLPYANALIFLFVVKPSLSGFLYEDFPKLLLAFMFSTRNAITPMIMANISC